MENDCWHVRKKPGDGLFLEISLRQGKPLTAWDTKEDSTKKAEIDTKKYSWNSSCLVDVLFFLGVSEERCWTRFEDGWRVIPRWPKVKGSTCQCRSHKTRVSISGWGRSPGGGNGNSLQYSCQIEHWCTEDNQGPSIFSNSMQQQGMEE